jgi:hypothetical protein
MYLLGERLAGVIKLVLIRLAAKRLFFSAVFQNAL